MQIMPINNINKNKNYDLSNPCMKGALSVLKDAVSHGQKITQTKYDEFIKLIPIAANGEIDKLCLDKTDKNAFNRFNQALRNYFQHDSSAKKNSRSITMQELGQLLKNNILEEKSYNEKYAEITSDSNGWPISIKSEAKTMKTSAMYLGLTKPNFHVDKRDFNNKIWASPIQKVWDGTKQDYFVWDAEKNEMRFFDGEWAPRSSFSGYHYKNQKFLKLNYRHMLIPKRIPCNTNKQTCQLENRVDLANLPVILVPLY